MTPSATAEAPRPESADVYPYRRRPEASMPPGRDHCAICRGPVADLWDAYVVENGRAIVHAACRRAGR